MTINNVVNSTAASDDINAESGVPSEPADEVTLIEQRRKRREAIKAKYRGQATPLLVQALQLGTKTESTTPNADILRANNDVSGKGPALTAVSGLKLIPVASSDSRLTWSIAIRYTW